MNAEEQDVSLLDLLLVVAENIKLLILGPTVAGAIALGLTFSLPNNYSSEAVVVLPNNSNANANDVSSVYIPTPQQAVGMMTSPLVLNQIAGITGKSSGYVSKQIKAVVGKDGLLRLSVSAPKPEQAQKLAEAVLDAWLKSTEPGGQEREDLQRRLVYAKAALGSVSQMFERVAKEGRDTSTRIGVESGDGAFWISAGELQSRFASEVVSLERALKGVSVDVIKQRPTLPLSPVAPKRAFIVLATTMTAGIALLFWVFMRQAWRRAVQDPQTAEKLARVRAALWPGR